MVEISNVVEISNKEMHPGKQTFIDDFFIESMVGAHRVLNPAEKLTVDEPPSMITPGPTVGERHR